MSRCEPSVFFSRYTSFLSIILRKWSYPSGIIEPSPTMNDPTLLFTNAGMNQFKDVLIDKRDYKRSSAKCVNTMTCRLPVTIRFDAAVIFSFAIILNKSHSILLGVLTSDKLAWHPKINFYARCITPMMKPLIFGATWWDCHRTHHPYCDNKGRSILPDNFWAMGGIGPCGQNPVISILWPSRRAYLGRSARYTFRRNIGDRFVEMK